MTTPTTTPTRHRRRNNGQERRYRKACQNLAAAVGIEITLELEAPLFSRARERLWTGGWQAGKSVSGALAVWLDLAFIDRTRVTIDGQPDPYRYWYIVPSYQDPAKEIDYLEQWARALGWLQTAHRPTQSASRLDLMVGQMPVIIETRTAQNIAGISGEPCDGVVVVEAGQQPEAVRTQAQGRVMFRDGWIAYTGTLEDDDNHPRWVWYGELAQENLGADSPDVEAFAVPSWANPMYSGPDDPRIDALRRVMDEYTFARRVAAIPTGVQNQVYRAITAKQSRLLRPLPWAVCIACRGTGADRCPECAGQGRTLPFTWIDGAGGIDFGTVHPSAVTAVSLNNLGEAWVRASRLITSQDPAGEIEQAMRDFERDFGIYRWGLDPQQRWAASIYGGSTEATRLGDGSRQGRIGLVNRRLHADSLLYDEEGEGVRDLYREQGRVHYVVNNQGLLILPRVADDMTSSLEDAIEVLDAGVPTIGPGKAITETEQAPAAAPKPRENQLRETTTMQEQAAGRRETRESLPGRRPRQ